MTIYKLDKTHKLEVVGNADKTYCSTLFVKVYSNNGIEWIKFESVLWYSLDDLKHEYCIE